MPDMEVWLSGGPYDGATDPPETLPSGGEYLLVGTAPDGKPRYRWQPMFSGRRNPCTQRSCGPGCPSGGAGC